MMTSADKETTGAGRAPLKVVMRRVLRGTLLLVQVYLLALCFYPFGPWYDHFRYQLGLERSWAFALLTMSIGVTVASVWRRSARVRVGTLCIFILLGLGVKWTLDEERRLRSDLLHADHLAIRRYFIEDSGRWSNRVVATIDDQAAIRHIAETLRFNQDPPWRIVHYFTVHGDFTVELVGSDDEIISEIVVINQGAAIRWNPWMHTDRHMPDEFQETLIGAVIAALPSEERNWEICDL